MRTVFKILKITLITFVILLVICMISIVLILEPSFKIAGWQSLDKSYLNSIEKTISVLDNEDNILVETLYNKNKIYAPIENIQVQTIDAFISVEDHRFYQHSGVDYLRIFSAVASNISSMSFKEGASTISQQLIKNTHLSSDKTMLRKIQEIRIAKELERNYTKDEILEMYLNMLYFGNNVYGIGTASKLMFNKDINEISLEESALLAAIINNPLYYSPYENYENALNRRNFVLQRMYENDKISLSELENAQSRSIIVGEIVSSQNQYITSVSSSAAEILGCEETDLYLKNVTIGTNYDCNFQSMSDIVLKNSTFTTILNENYDEINAGIIILDNLSGDVLAHSSLNDLNLCNVVRQPGSVIKPIISYIPALEKNIIFPTSQILDAPTTFGDYAPSNYMDSYDGWTSMASALKKSSNIAAIKLLDMSGIEYSKSIARKCGYKFDAEDDSLALALGGMTYGVTLKQIANSYQPIANGGKFIDASYIRYIKDSYGNYLYKQNTTEKKVFSEESAYFMNEMLSVCVENGTARKLKGVADNICAKTGTVGDENGNTDAYCVAYTPEYTVAVWIGSTDNNSPHHYTGGSLPAAIVREIFDNIDLKNEMTFDKPKSIVSVELDSRELNNYHREVIASSDTPPRYKTSAEFTQNYVNKLNVNSITNERENKEKVEETTLQNNYNEKTSYIQTIDPNIFEIVA